MIHEQETLVLPADSPCARGLYIVPYRLDVTEIGSIDTLADAEGWDKAVGTVHGQTEGACVETRIADRCNSAEFGRFMTIEWAEGQRRIIGRDASQPTE